MISTKHEQFRRANTKNFTQPNKQDTIGTSSPLCISRAACGCGAAWWHTRLSIMFECVPAAWNWKMEKEAPLCGVLLRESSEDKQYNRKFSVRGGGEKKSCDTMDRVRSNT